MTRLGIPLDEIETIIKHRDMLTGGLNLIIFLYPQDVSIYHVDADYEITSYELRRSVDKDSLVELLMVLYDPDESPIENSLLVFDGSRRKLVLRASSTALLQNIHRLSEKILVELEKITWGKENV